MIIRIALALIFCLHAGMVWAVACDAIFTNGVQSHALGGSITFGGNTVVNGGSQTLHTTDLNMESWSQAICGGSVCNSSGSPAAASSPTFVTGNTTNGAINVPATITQSRAAGNYNTVTVGQEATLTFTGTNYRTRATTTNFRSRIQFSPGTYWINGNLTLGQETILQRIGAAGTVRIFVNGNVSMGFRVATQNFTHGQLLIYATGSITTQNEANLTAQVYAGGTVTFGFASVLHGSVSGSSVNIAQAMTVNFNSDALSTGDFAPFCDGISAPVLLGSWRMDEPYWNGLANEVIDSSGNNNHGRARIAAGSTPTASTALVTPAFTNGNQSTCSYGQFDSTSAPLRTNTYLELSGFPALPSSFTFTAWIRSTNAGAQHQRILVRDDADNGWGLSLADGTGEPRLRFFNRNIQNTGTVTGQGRNGDCGVFCLDTNTVIATNAWHYVAATIDTTARTVTLYVYSASGSLLARTTGSFSGNWVDGTGTAAIGGETLASNEGRQSSFHFLGNIDEVEIYIGALTQDDIVSLRTRVRSCPLISPHHYELQVPPTSIACMATPVTVVACADSSSPCTNSFLAAGGTTANLAVSGGSLANTTLAFNAGGVASTFLTHPLVANGTPVTVTLSGEQLAGLNPRQCCQGSSCSLNACTTTFNSAGLAFATTSNPDVAGIPSQVAGLIDPDDTIILRAVKTPSDTPPIVGACEARVTGPRDVQLAYECINPTSCIAGQTLLLTGNQIQANNDGDVIAYSIVPLSFNAPGMPPGTALIPLNYSDVGKVRLHARLPIAAAAPEPAVILNGESNEFVVKPYTLEVIDIPNNPGTTSSGNGFIPAGAEFAVRIEARNADNVVTPNFGNELDFGTNLPAPENKDISLDIGNSHCAPKCPVLDEDGLVIEYLPEVEYPQGGSHGELDIESATSIPAGAEVMARWSEVGTIKLLPRLLDNDYLGAGDLKVLTSSDPVGRFFPDHFEINVSSPEKENCGSFYYMGQPFNLDNPDTGLNYMLTAVGHSPENQEGKTLANYDTDIGFAVAAVKNYAFNITHSLNERLVDRQGEKLRDTESVENKLKWINGVLVLNAPDAQFGRVAAPDGPYSKVNIGVGITDCMDRRMLNGRDLVLNTSGICGAPTDNAYSLGEFDMRFGRLRLDDAFGPESVDLPVIFITEYWTGTHFARSWGDSCTKIPLTAIEYDRDGDLPPPPVQIDTPTNRTVSLNGGSTQGIYHNLLLNPVDDHVVFDGGDARHFFSAPGTGTGNFNVNVNFGSEPCNPVNDANCIPWLRYDWNQNGNHNDDIRLRANIGFGQYRGHDRIIYWREVFE